MSDNDLAIGSRVISKDFPPFIIVEVSANHNGSISKSLSLRRKEIGLLWIILR